jgi:hypothetical protein
VKRRMVKEENGKRGEWEKKRMGKEADGKAKGKDNFIGSIIQENATLQPV